MRSVEIEVHFVEGRTWPQRALTWVVALWWPALLLTLAALVVASTPGHYTDDGDPSVRVRFGSWWDVALVVGLIAALALEARKVVVWWIRRRLARHPAVE